MNKQSKINILIQSINHLDRKEGYVKVYCNNTLEHENIKFLITYKFKKLGYKTYSECRINGGRVDLAIISPEGVGTIIEIRNSESDKRFNEKLNNYDLIWNIVDVSTKNFKLEEFQI